MTYRIEEKVWSDRVSVAAYLEGDFDICIAQGLYFPRTRSGHIWSGEAILNDLKERPGGRGRAVYDTTLGGIRALVAQEAAVAPVEALLAA